MPQRGLTALVLFFHWDSVPNPDAPRVSFNPPDPLSKGAIRAYGLSIAAGPSLPASSGPASDDLLNPPNPLLKGAHQAFVRTRAHDHRFAVLRPASDDALAALRTLLLRFV